MTDETAHARDCNDATVTKGNGISEQAEAHGRYVISCVGADGKSNGRKPLRMSFARSARTDAR